MHGTSLTYLLMPSVADACGLLLQSALLLAPSVRVPSLQLQFWRRQCKSNLTQQLTDANMSAVCCCLQSAVDAGAISARAKPAAAAEKARDLQAALKARGCVEEFTPDPELMAEGQVRRCVSILYNMLRMCIYSTLYM
jgi:hypothetical protein